MAELLRMPEVSANLESAVLASWSIAEGESFRVKDIVAVIETEKAVVDFEVEVAGVLVRKLVVDGAEVPVGDPIAVVASLEEAIGDVEAVIAQLVGDAESISTQPTGTRAVSSEIPDAVHSSAPAPETTLGGARRFSSPLARKLARQAGLALLDVNGTGPGGRIVRRDVVAAIQVRDASSTIVAQVSESAHAPAASAFTDTPHSRLRKVIASRLMESKATAPHFYLRGSAEVSSLLRMREEINAGGDVRVSVNDILIKAMSKAHLAVPGLNVIWTPEAIRAFSAVDLSVAISTPGGLVTPVIRGVDAMSVSEIARTVKDFAERGRTGRLQQAELEGGTATISNLGMFGTEEFAAIINPPQASILAVGATRQEAVVRDGEVLVGTVLRYTLSVDHRPVDGVLAAEWMRAFTDLLEHPARILA